jgi:hypothetical protein
MRDIRSDLKERLAQAERTRAGLTAQLKEVDAEVAALMNLMEIEDRRGVSDGKSQPPAEPVQDFLISAISQNPMTKDELKNAAVARGYPVDGRSIHAYVTNLTKTGRLVKGRDEKFQVTTDPSREPVVNH